MKCGEKERKELTANRNAEGNSQLRKTIIKTDNEHSDEGEKRCKMVRKWKKTEIKNR